MMSTKRDNQLLRALDRGDTPQGSHNDVERLNAILGEHCINRANPLHEPPYLFLQRHFGAKRKPEDVLREWLDSAVEEQNHGKN